MWRAARIEGKGKQLHNRTAGHKVRVPGRDRIQGADQGFTVTCALRFTPANEAVTVTNVGCDTAEVVIGKVTLALPPGTRAQAGTLTEGSELLNCT